MDFPICFYIMRKVLHESLLLHIYNTIINHSQSIIYFFPIRYLGVFPGKNLAGAVLWFQSVVCLEQIQEELLSWLEQQTAVTIKTKSNTYRNSSFIIQKIKGRRPRSTDHTLTTAHDVQHKTPQQNQKEDYSTRGHNAVSSSQAQYSQWVRMRASLCVMSRVSDFGVLSDRSSKSQCLTWALRLSIASPFPPCLFLCGVWIFTSVKREQEKGRWWRNGKEREWKVECKKG